MPPSLRVWYLESAPAGNKINLIHSRFVIPSQSSVALGIDSLTGAGKRKKLWSPLRMLSDRWTGIWCSEELEVSLLVISLSLETAEDGRPILGDVDIYCPPKSTLVQNFPSLRIHQKQVNYIEWGYNLKFNECKSSILVGCNHSIDWKILICVIWRIKVLPFFTHFHNFKITRF